MATQFTDQNVKELIASGKPVVIDCWATWCGPCVRMSPIIDELAEQFGDKAVIGKYNIDEQSDLTAEHRIMSIPQGRKACRPSCRLTAQVDTRG